MAQEKDIGMGKENRCTDHHKQLNGDDEEEERQLREIQKAQTKVNKEVKREMEYLRPPSPKNLYLISPPASPPVGWAPVNEGKPVINYELLAALSKLTPGEAHEIHAPTEKNHPAIVLHVCEADDDDLVIPKAQKVTIVPTKRPVLPTSSLVP